MPDTDTPGQVTTAENLSKEHLVSNSNVGLPVGCLLCGSWQPSPTIGELKTVRLIPPAGLREPVRQALDATFDGINTTAGHALAHFIISGHLTSHLARAARTYAARRRALIAALRNAAPALQVTGVDAGLHLCANLPPGSSETAAQQRLRDAGPGIEVLSQYARTAITQQALVCSYARNTASRAKALPSGHRVPDDQSARPTHPARSHHAHNRSARRELMKRHEESHPG